MNLKYTSAYRLPRVRPLGNVLTTPSELRFGFLYIDEHGDLVSLSNNVPTVVPLEGVDIDLIECHAKECIVCDEDGHLIRRTVYFIDNYVLAGAPVEDLTLPGPMPR